MKRLLIIALMLVPVALCGAAPIAFAQSNPTTSTPGSGTANTPTSNTGTNTNANTPGSNAGTSGGTQSSDGAHQPTDQNDFQQVTKGYNSVMLFLMGIFAWLLGVAALVLDYATYYGVVAMGNYVRNLSAIGTVWQIMTNLGNIVLLFGFVAIGISVILDNERLGYGKKLLPKLLLAAIFINFSLFFAEAIIDVGNLFATELYAQINGGHLPSINTQGEIIGVDGKSPLGTHNDGVAISIMNHVGLNTIYGDVINGNSDVLQKIFSGTSASYIGFLSIILFLITAFVMFSLAIILIVRVVVLILLIILAPIGFAGMAIPKLSGYASQWWNTLIEQTLVAPVLLLVLYVALKVITDGQFLGGFVGGGDTTALGQSGWLSFLQSGGKGLPAFAGLTLSFLVAMGLLIAVTVIAKKMSAVGAGFATKWGSRLSGAGLAVGAVGLTGRYTIGMGSRYVGQKLGNTAFGRSFAGRGLVSGLERASKSSFDVRHTGIGKVASKAGLDLGAAHKGGYEESLKKRAESYKKAADRISGGREQTRGEKQQIAAAEEKALMAGNEHSIAQLTHGKSVTAHEEARQRLAELEAQQKGSLSASHFAEVEKARETVAQRKLERDAMQRNLESAQLAHEKAQKEAKETETKIKAATTEKGRKEAYYNRLEKWGKIPLIGTAAGEAVKNKVKKDKDSKNFEKAVTEFVKNKEAEESKKAEAGEKKGSEKEKKEEGNETAH